MSIANTLTRSILKSPFATLSTSPFSGLDDKENDKRRELNHSSVYYVSAKELQVGLSSFPIALFFPP